VSAPPRIPYRGASYGTGVMRIAGLTRIRASAATSAMTPFAAKLAGVSGSSAATTRWASGCSSET
jgi:hypothetical protein